MASKYDCDRTLQTSHFDAYVHYIYMTIFGSGTLLNGFILAAILGSRKSFFVSNLNHIIAFLISSYFLFDAWISVTFISCHIVEYCRGDAITRVMVGGNVTFVSVFLVGNTLLAMERYHQIHGTDSKRVKWQNGMVVVCSVVWTLVLLAVVGTSMSVDAETPSEMPQFLVWIVMMSITFAFCTAAMLFYYTKSYTSAVNALRSLDKSDAANSSSNEDGSALFMTAIISREAAPSEQPTIQAVRTAIVPAASTIPKPSTSTEWDMLLGCIAISVALILCYFPYLLYFIITAHAINSGTWTLEYFGPFWVVAEICCGLDNVISPIFMLVFQRDLRRICLRFIGFRV
ncbi:hypothetical protein BDR26DRAFT_861749 [Obelidium mucronatum]|nr:hypothetical protein BDR26DRAFT_861749 [Obelidium mucronatum]